MLYLIGLNGIKPEQSALSTDCSGFKFYNRAESTHLKFWSCHTINIKIIAGVDSKYFSGG